MIWSLLQPKKTKSPVVRIVPRAWIAHAAYGLYRYWREGCGLPSWMLVAAAPGIPVDSASEQCKTQTLMTKRQKKAQTSTEICAFQRYFISSKSTYSLSSFSKIFCVCLPEEWEDWDCFFSPYWEVS